MMTLSPPKQNHWERFNKERCHICGRKNDGCLINYEAGKIICLHESSDEPVQEGIGGHYHTIDGHMPVKRLVKPKEKKQHNIATDEILHRIGEILIKENGLTDKHKDYLVGRYINPEGYGTLNPVSGRSKDWYGSDPTGVPGFYRSWQGDWQLNCNTTGILIPVKSLEGKITGFQIRTDDGGAKYRWLSTNNFHCGSKARMSAHYVHVPESKEVWITEGVFKAEIGSEKLARSFFAIPGVHLIDDLLKQLRRSDFTKVVVALDMDRLTNQNVLMAYQKLVDTLTIHDYEVWTSEWNPQHKGIDDLLLAGGRPTTSCLHKPEYISLNKGRKDMTTLIKKTIKENHPGIQVIKTTVGGGKTTAVINEINEMEREGTWATKGKMRSKYKRILFLMDNHTLLKELQAKFEFDVPILKGRQDDQWEPFYCQNKALCDKAGAAGHNVVKSVCAECPMFNSIKPTESACRYWVDTYKTNKSKMVLATKHSYLNHSERLENFDIVFIDEGLSEFLFNDIHITQDDIFDHLEIVDYLQEQGQNIPEDDLYLQRLMALSELMQNAEDDDIEQREVFFDKIDHDVPYSEDRAYRISRERWIYPKKFLQLLDKGSCYITKEGIRVKVPRLNVLRLLKSRTTVNLDATPVMSMIGNIGATLHEFNIRQHMVVHQVKSVKGSRRQLGDPVYQQKFIKAINAVSKKHKKTVLFSIKSFVDEHRESLDADAGHFGFNTRATNDYQDYDAIIITDWCINMDYAQQWASAINMLTEHKTSVTMDQLIQEIADNEKQQALGRGRATQRTKNNPLYAYVFSNRDMNGIRVDNYILNLEALSGEEYKRDTINRERKKKAEFNPRRLLRYWCNEKGVDPHLVTVEKLADKSGASKDVCRRILREYMSSKIQAQNVPECYANMEAAYATNEQAPNAVTDKVGQIGRATILRNTKAGGKSVVRYLFREQFNFLLKQAPKGIDEGVWTSFIDACILNPVTKSELSRLSGLSRRKVDSLISIAFDLLGEFEMAHHEKDLQTKKESMQQWLGVMATDHYMSLIGLISNSYNVDNAVDFLEKIKSIEALKMTDEVLGFIVGLYKIWWDLDFRDMVYN